jgi:hypothetical protein
MAAQAGSTDPRDTDAERWYCLGKLNRIEGRPIDKHMPNVDGLRLDAWLIGWREQEKESGGAMMGDGE